MCKRVYLKTISRYQINYLAVFFFKTIRIHGSDRTNKTPFKARTYIVNPLLADHCMY